MAAIEQDLDAIFAFLEDVFGIYKRYFRIHKIEPGCIKVTLQFPADMQQLIQGCIDQKYDAFKQYAISMQILKLHEMQGKENPSVDDKRDNSSSHNQDESTRTDRNSPLCKSSQFRTSKPETNHNSPPQAPLLAFDLDDQCVLCIPCFDEEEKSQFQEIITNSSYELSNASDEEMVGSTSSDSSCHTSDLKEEMAPQPKRIRSN